ncbi:MAG: hypothetical protein JW966_08875 [Anaerolineae bacterium]|nr:hypothetical protein [Anaerolineae bacterium]
MRSRNHVGPMLLLAVVVLLVSVMVLVSAFKLLPPPPLFPTPTAPTTLDRPEGRPRILE